MSAQTEVLDLPGAMVLPPFDDTHTHLLLAALRSQDVIPVQ
ncbi:hypothetical protein [Streptomyces sp. NPDC050416]